MKSLLIGAAFALAAISCLGGNWPRFRGPDGQGHSTETNLPVTWSTNQNVAWVASIPGEGWSSPIVWNDRVFLTSTTEGGAKCHIFCIDAHTGRLHWERELFTQLPRRKENKNSYATPTPVTDGHAVFVTFGDGSMAGLSMSGSVLWTNREVKFYSRHGLGSSPIVYNGLVIQCFDGSNPVSSAGNWPEIGDEEGLGWRKPWDRAVIVALDSKTGRRVWTGKRGLSRIAHVTPLITIVDGKGQLISGAGDRMQGFDPATGELIWSVYQQGEGVTPSPVIGSGLLFTSSGFEKTTLRALKLGGAKGDVTASHIVWEQRKGVPTQPSPIYVAPYLYSVTDGGGMVSCYKGETGEIVWQERIGGNYSASPVFADGKLYILSETAETTVVEPGTVFRVLARNKLPGRAQASMAVAGGRMFIRTDTALYCVGGH